MTEDFNEKVGVAAGKVWAFLNENSLSSATKISEATKLDKNEVQRALGWLAREGKLFVERQGKNDYFNINQA